MKRIFGHKHLNACGKNGSFSSRLAANQHVVKSDEWKVLCAELDLCDGWYQSKQPHRMGAWFGGFFMRARRKPSKSTNNDAFKRYVYIHCYLYISCSRSLHVWADRIFMLFCFMHTLAAENKEKNMHQTFIFKKVEWETFEWQSNTFHQREYGSAAQKYIHHFRKWRNECIWQIKSCKTIALRDRTIIYQGKRQAFFHLCFFANHRMNEHQVSLLYRATFFSHV